MDQENTMATRYEREIPEGYEARIEGNKVIIELKESDDERIRKSILALVKKHAVNHERCQMEAYLEKQKEQQHAEWGEEDENRIKSIKATLEQFAYANNMLDVNGDCCDASMIKNINWLKSLRPQHHWKPSEELMVALARATNRCAGVEDAKNLIKLLEQLESL